ncbi:tenascin-like [Branchiostoma floridae x Branchiostoma belcheri]
MVGTIYNDPGWWVDLGQSYVVGRVVIFNRQDSRQDRLNPFNIHIGDSDQVSTNPKCGGDHHIELNQPFISVSCLGMMGRYVGVRLPGASRVLSLCEVQIYLADRCPPLCPPTNGTMRGSNYFGDVITFTCDSGYRLVGASSLTCQIDATWTGTAPTCTDVDECVAGNGCCEQFCTNTIGSFNCSCAAGFTLNVDQITCSGMPPPANISVKHVSEKSATVQWEQPVRDVLIGYRAWLTDKETMLTILTQYLPELVTTATFSPLTPATEYVVAVTCISPYVEGPQAEVLVVTYTDPPRQLYVEDITYKSLLLSWIPPVAKLTGYELTYSKKEHYRKRRSVRSVTLPGDITNYAVQGLVPVTQYVISLTAVSRFGKSKAIKSTAITGLDRPSELQVKAASSSWIYVVWTPPVVSVVSYDIEVTEPDIHINIHLSIPPVFTGFNITGLLPMTKYTIRLAAVTKYGRSAQAVSHGSTVDVVLDPTLPVLEPAGTLFTTAGTPLTTQDSHTLQRYLTTSKITHTDTRDFFKPPPPEMDNPELTSISPATGTNPSTTVPTVFLTPEAPGNGRGDSSKSEATLSPFQVLVSFGFPWK